MHNFVQREYLMRSAHETSLSLTGGLHRGGAHLSVRGMAYAPGAYKIFSFTHLSLYIISLNNIINKNFYNYFL